MRSVRRLSYGAAPSAQALLQRAQAALPWAGLFQYYGMTESCGAATASMPGDHDAQAWSTGRARSAGRASAVVELRILDEDAHDLPVGEVGEIVLRGPLVAAGYWRRPEETARTFNGGWLRTGDAGRVDQDGYLYVVDRIKDMIVSGGENVYSAEVENALARHPAVSMAAVIGVPHERWGEAVHAIVVLQHGMTADEAALRAHCRALLADYKVPKCVEFIAELPLTAAGKVAKNILRERYGKP
jgi:long-chain acyl-CoA synthetase